MTESRAPFLQLPGGPDPAAPVPRTPVDGFDLRAFAGVAAALTEKREPRAATLARFGLDEMRWLAIEQTWLLRVTTALLQQDASLREEHDRAFADAQAALVNGPPPSLDEYAAVVAAIEDGREPAQAIAAAGLTVAGFAGAHRAWAARIAADKELASSFRALVAARRGGA